MSSLLRSWARTLGGEVSGKGVLCPGPGHGPRDRSLSVMVSAAAPDGFIVHSFANDDPLACKDYVRRQLGLSPFLPGQKRKAAPLKQAHGGQSEPAGYIARTEPKKIASELPSKAKRSMDTAAWLWGRREPCSESNAAGRYLRGTRGFMDAFPRTLGYLPAAGCFPGAMVAAFGFCDEPEPGWIAPPAIVTGIHLTRLTPEGEKIAGNKPKIMLGAMSGLPIVLAPVNDCLGLAITEGIEDGLSVFAETGLGVWAAGSAGNMVKIAASIPPYVECTTIFAHRDETGLRFAKDAAGLIAAMGTEVHLKGRG
jgi:Toprim domain